MVSIVPTVINLYVYRVSLFFNLRVTTCENLISIYLQEKI